VRLADEDRARVVRLASILRLADALDREHLQRVLRVRAKLDRQTLTLEPEGAANHLLESWALQRNASMFEKTFDRKVRLGEAQAAS
jgi:exopolyphosphatase/guanosine-5'-triphosphate,3'-diphosphate pyrophosphatase